MNLPVVSSGPTKHKLVSLPAGDTRKMEAELAKRRRLEHGAVGSGAPAWQASGSSGGAPSGELRHVAPGSGALPPGARGLRAAATAVIAANRFAMPIGADGVRRASLIGAIDTTGDGVADAAAVDTTGDGYADARGYDTSGDGVIDALDTTGDGLIDATLEVRVRARTRARLSLIHI